MRALLDTSVLIAATSAHETAPDLAGLAEVSVSALSIAELRMGLSTALAGSARAYRDRLVQFGRIEAAFGETLPFDDDCARGYGRITDLVAERGGDPKAHRLDRMIAATALAHDLVLVTRNPADVRLIGELVEVVER